jgi:hypothetical protein
MTGEKALINLLKRVNILIKYAVNYITFSVQACLFGFVIRFIIRFLPYMSG